MGSKKPDIFVSHTHLDEQLAAAVQSLIEQVSFNQIRVRRSSQKGEIQSGESWIDWIYARLETCDLAIVLLTPSSFKGNWVLWEAGAVTGVQRARVEAESSADPNQYDRRVRPVQFGSIGDDLGPFKHIQITNGLHQIDLQKFLKNMLTDFLGKEGVEDRLIYDGIEGLSEAVRTFLPKAREALKSTPVYKTEGLIQEWLSRLDRHLERKEYEKIRTSRRWINIAFIGIGGAEAEEPIDFRIHMRLGHGFSALKDWKAAGTQLELARKLSPRDMFCLRMLGRVELELNGFSAAQEVIKEMMEYDPDILTKDEEAVALQYRIFADQGSWVDALGLLDKAANLAVKSYYLANLRALAAMKLDGLGSALARFKELLMIVQKSGDRSVYAHGTAVNACLALGDSKAAEEELKAVNDFNESKDTLGSISKYYDLISEERRKIDRDFNFQWSNILKF